MAVYVDAQSLLDAALGDYHDDGIRLTKVGDLLLLFCGSSLIADFDWRMATLTEVQSACQRYLEIGEL